MTFWMLLKKAVGRFSRLVFVTSTVQKSTVSSIPAKHLKRFYSSSIRRGILSPTILQNQEQAMSLANNHVNATIATAKVDCNTNNKALTTNPQNKNKSETNLPDCAIIRYSTGDERFQFKLTLRNGKVFNFDRSVGDPLQSFIDRMVTNIGKKVKTFDGNVAFLESPKTNDKHVVPEPEHNNWEKTSNSVPLEDLLNQFVTGLKRLNVQVGEEIYDVAINPPEIYAIKFLKNASVDFPTFPIKIETSSKFQRDESKYIWEFIPASEIKSPKVENRPKKKGGENLEVTKSNSIWKDTGCRTLVFVPGKDLLGSILRFKVIPSDGSGFGIPFSVELPSVVEPSLVKEPLYLERLSRMKSNNNNRTDLNFIRVVSYNCLADCYATEEWFIASPKECLSADFRLPFLIKEMEAYSADLYCLQEVDEKYFERHFTPFFNCQLNYEGVFSSKIGQTKEGVATFYNPRKFDLIRNDTVVILEHMKLQSFWKSISSLSKEFLARLEERNTVLQVSIFKPKASENTILVVANTHLYFHPDADHIRGLQTITCVDYIEKTVAEMKIAFPAFKVAVLFCGDFNCTPPFSSYRFLTTGKIEEDDEDWTSHPEQKLIPGICREHKLNLTNSHSEEGLTNITTHFEGCLDYVLYQSEHFKLLDVYPVPDKSVIASTIGVDEIRKVSLPNFHTPSDHLPLIADFMLISPEQKS